MLVLMYLVVCAAEASRCGLYCCPKGFNDARVIGCSHAFVVRKTVSFVGHCYLNGPDAFAFTNHLVQEQLGIRRATGLFGSG